MRSASISKFVVSAILAATVALALTGCGFFGNDSHNLKLTNGNWSIAATSSVPANGTFYIGGNLAQSGSSLSGKLYIVGSLCFDVSQAVVFSGTVSGNKVTLTSASVQGQVLTITATGDSNSLSGTYTKSGGGNCLTADQGTAIGNTVQLVTGTWNGPIVGSGGSSVTLSIALTQASTASPDGTFALTGNLTYSNSSCDATGTISSGSLAGPYLVGFTATTNSGDLITYAGGMLDSTTAPKTITNGTYDVGGGGPCDGDSDTPTFTKQ